jgi:hypothetical protein
LTKEGVTYPRPWVPMTYPADVPGARWRNNTCNRCGGKLYTGDATETRQVTPTGAQGQIRHATCPEAKTIGFVPMPTSTGQGYVALQIFPPGAWMGQPGWHAFVGGNGIGTADTLEDAKTMLLAGAIRYCDRRIAEATHILVHNTTQRAKLMAEGLKEQG